MDLKKNRPQQYKQSNSGLSLYRFGDGIIDSLVSSPSIRSALAISDTTQNKSSEVKLKAATLLMAREIASQPCVEYAEPNYLRHSLLIANDSLYSKHWQFEKIHLADAWDTTTGSDQIKVAMLDSGVVMTHPDLRSRLSVEGYDFVRDSNFSSSGDGDGIDANPEDPGDGVDNQDCDFADNSDRRSSFHGTRVTGIAGASTDNSIGIAGIDWNAKIMPLRVLGCLGADDYAISQAIRYAAGLENSSGITVAQPADIINLSLGNQVMGTTLAGAVADAIDADVIVIAAAGNNATSTPVYPAAFPGVISVVATNVNNQKAQFSSYGSSIDIAAPGVGIWSTMASYQDGVITADYLANSGTSMAAPHVAGVASLMKSVYSSMTADDFEAILISGNITDDLGDSGRDDQFGFGLINAQKAVEYAKQIADGSISMPKTPILGLTHSYINFGSTHTEVILEASNIGSKNATLIIDDVQCADHFVTVTEPNTENGLGDYIIRIDRTDLSPNVYQSSVQFIPDSGGEKTVSLVFRVPDSGREQYGTAGNLSLQLTNIDTDEVAKIYVADPLKGKYHFSFPQVAAGNYKLKVGNDLDNNGILCEVAEGCGHYGTDLSPLQVNQVVNNLQLRLQY